MKGRSVPRLARCLLRAASIFHKPAAYCEQFCVAGRRCDDSCFFAAELVEILFFLLARFHMISVGENIGGVLIVKTLQSQVLPRCLALQFFARFRSFEFGFGQPVSRGESLSAIQC